MPRFKNNQDFFDFLMSEIKITVIRNNRGLLLFPFCEAPSDIRRLLPQSIIIL